MSTPRERLLARLPEHRREMAAFWLNHGEVATAQVFAETLDACAELLDQVDRERDEFCASQIAWQEKHAAEWERADNLTRERDEAQVQIARLRDVVLSVHGELVQFSEVRRVDGLLTDCERALSVPAPKLRKAFIVTARDGSSQAFGRIEDAKDYNFEGPRGRIHTAYIVEADHV